MRAPLVSVVERLPRLQGQPSLREDEPDAAFSAIVTSQPGYVWPDLLVDESESGAIGDSPILLIRAPGAMGKSAAARAVAHSLGCPRIDLAKLRVGSNGLTGLLTSVLGWQQAPAYIQSLQSGEQALVLDSTDEAQLAAGQDSYLAFLSDIARLIRGAASQGQLIIFGRPDATMTTYYGFAEFGINPVIAEIAPLTHAQSCELIDNTLDNKSDSSGPYRVHRVFSEPFGRLRDQSFLGIAQALQPDAGESDYWEKTDAFLGYPPVLMALAERLAVKNPQEEVALAARGTGRRRQGELLRQVVEDILEREKGKVRAAVAEAIQLPPDDPRCEVLYTREEQCLRLLQHVSGAPIDMQAPASLQPVERAKYEELVVGFTADHPFLREVGFTNAVFEDYVRAFLATAPLGEASGVTRRALLSALPRSGPFFSHFVHALGVPRVSDWSATSEELVADIVTSYVSGVPAAGFTYTHQGEKALLSLYNGSYSDIDETHDALFFRIEDQSGILTLNGPLARAFVVTDHAVILNGPNGNLSLGPDLVVFARSLEIVADAVTVIGGAATELSMIVSVEVVHDGRLKVTAHPEDSLAVSWPNAWHQWKPFIFDIGAHRLRDVDPGVSQQTFVTLRRMLMSFGSASGNDPLVYVNKFDRFAVGTSDLGVAVHGALLTLGVISRQGAVYRLHLDALSQFEVAWAKLHGSDVAQSLGKLHAEVMKQDSVREIARKAPRGS